MRARPRLRFMVAALAALYPVAMLTRNPMPAIVATTGLAVLLHARWRFGKAVASAKPRVHRTVEPATVRQGETATVRLVADAAFVPGTALELIDTPPDTVRAPPAPRGMGPLVEYSVRAHLRGRHEWSRLRIGWQDGTGFWDHHATLNVPSRLEVELLADATGPGRRAGTRVQTSTTDPLGILREELEIHGVRPFQPGDRGRDIDWKRFARGQGILSKDWEKQARPPFWVLADASWTMRSRLGDVAKFDHAAGLAAEMLRSAQARELKAGFALYDARDVLARQETGLDDVAARLRAQVARLPPARQAASRSTVGSMMAGAHDFAGALQALQGRAPHSGIRQALRGVSTQKRPLLLVLTDAHGAGKDLVDGVRSAANQGARCTVAFLTDDAYYAPPTRPTAHDLVAVARERRRVEHVRSLLGQAGVRCISLTPADTARLILREGSL